MDAYANAQKLDRHIESCSLVHEYFTGIAGIDPPFVDQFRCNLSTIMELPSSLNFFKPAWLLHLEVAYPKLHIGLSQVLSIASTMMDNIVGRVIGAPLANAKGGVIKRDANKKDAGKDVGKKDARKKDVRKDVEKLTKEKPPSIVRLIEREAMILESNVHPAIARDHQILYYRLEMIGMYAEDVILEDAVQYIMDSMHEAIPMWYHCRLEGSKFEIDQSELMREPGPQGPTDTIEWHFKILDVLATKLKATFRDYLDVEQVKEEAIKVIDETHNLFKDDPIQGLVPRLPSNKLIPYGPFQIWFHKVEEIIKASCEELKNVPEGWKLCLDWRSFIIALADSYFGSCISNSTLNDILEARVDFFLVVATKDVGDPTKGFMTLQDFLKTPVWFDIDVDENVKVEDKKTEASFNFGKVLKTFVYGVLDKGDIGLPWHTLLLYLCHDAHKPLGVQKAFSVLGGCMSPEDLALTVEEVLCGLYPSGVQGAEEAGLKPWTMHDIEWTGMECVEPKKEPLLTKAEFMVVMDDFLKAVPPLPNTPSSQVSGVSSQANRAISDFVHCVQGEPIKVLELLTLDDVLTKKATSELCAALFEVYGQHCAWVVPYLSRERQRQRLPPLQQRRNKG
ncbi:unnamed protein product [Sphagnum jensenii]|uniref:SPEF2 C-terminal domain-containing protein n=1 Tax=Sphagnum jensenii TaxID=128206 RepID=A0ABP0WZI7_9BRYO